MRIGTLLGYSIWTAIAVVVGLIAAGARVAAGVDAASEAQAHARSATREVSQLLLLTHEYALYAEDRAAQQWREHQAALVRTLDAGTRDVVAVAAQAVAEAQGLEADFRHLTAAGSTPEPVRGRQVSLLLGQLLTSTRIVGDAVQRWMHEVERQRRTMEGRAHFLAIATPAATLSVLVALAALVHRRVLRPLSRLHAAVQAVARGDLTVSSATGTRDEFGELSRTFDAMAVELVSDLRREVQVRIAAQEKEHEARRAAEAANRAKSEFLAAMSHELRTPLNAILGYAQILRRDGSLPERRAAGLATIEQSGQHLLTLINDLLDLAKIEAGKFSLTPAPMNLAPALHVIADIVRIKAEEKSLRFVCDVSPNLPPAVLADEKRLRQVLLNLLGNAVKFTDRGQVSLQVLPLLAAPTGNALLRFEAVDTGVGMTPDQLGTIFEPFEQAGDVRRRAGGTGLGLSISRELVRLMGGDIHVESRIGIGSRFWFEIVLPLAEAALVTLAPAVDLPQAAGVAPEEMLVVPPAADLDVLHQLALAGDLRAIRRQAERLAAADARYAPFAAVLLRLAAAYRSKALLDFVEGHRPREETS